MGKWGQKRDKLGFTARDIQRQKETNRDRQRQKETERDKQRQKETNRDRHRQTETDRQRQKWTVRDLSDNDSDKISLVLHRIRKRSRALVGEKPGVPVPTTYYTGL